MSRVRADSGVTLIELLVAMVLTAVLGSAVFGVVASQLRAARTADDLRVFLDEARVAANRIQREARGATEVDIAASSPELLRLWIDHDGDEVPDVGEYTSFQFTVAADGVELRRSTDAAPTAVAIARHLTGASGFSYSPALGVGPPAVVTFRLVIDAGAGGTGPLEVTDSVRLRNGG